MRHLARIFAGPGMVLAGLNHFRVPRTYEAIMPGYLPAHRTLVLASGAVEVVGGVAAIYPPTRSLARPWLIGLLAAVFPVHIWMLQRPDLYPKVPRAGLWARVPLQFVMAWWVVQATDESRWATDEALGGR